MRRASLPPNGGRLLSIGECMVELMPTAGDLWRRSYAGDTFNTAYYARLFLADGWRVDYLTAVGTCAVSAAMLEFIETAGVGTEFVRRIEGGTPGLYMIHLHAGERSFSYWRSASAARRLADDPDHLRRAVASSDVVFFSGITLAILPPEAAGDLLCVLAQARADGRTIVFDPNIRPRLWDDGDRMREAISRGATVADLVMPSFDDEAAHFGDASVARTIARYRSLGAADVVVKDGTRGITLALGNDAPAFVPASPAPRVVDTTAAGDSFNGAFLARLIETNDAVAAATFAAAVAARVIQHHGALVDRDRLTEATG